MNVIGAVSADSLPRALGEGWQAVVVDAVIVKVALALLVGSATEVAVTVTEGFSGTSDGAEYRAVVEVSLESPSSVEVHVTPWPELSLATAADRLKVPSGAMVLVAPEMATEIFFELPLQPVSASARAKYNANLNVLSFTVSPWTFFR